MTPYFKQRGPPALVMMLPPMEFWRGWWGRRIKPVLFLHCGLEFSGDDIGSTTATKSSALISFDAVHPFQRQHDAAAQRQYSRRRNWVCAARRDRDAVFIGKPENGGH